jgi:glycosyltransferase involved in cell wall biosynthesis
MAECDYVVVPSKWWENSPVVIQEAYSNGVPVICTGIGGMAEKVRNGVSGLHFRLGDPVDLLRAIRAAANPQQAAALAGGIPPVTSAVDMAHAYASFFSAAAAVPAAATAAVSALGAAARRDPGSH